MSVLTCINQKLEIGLLGFSLLWCCALTPWIGGVLGIHTCLDPSRFLLARYYA